MNDDDSLEVVRELQDWANERPTLRDQFAMAALRSINFPKYDNAENRARKAYEQADAMLAERDGKGG